MRANYNIREHLPPTYLSNRVVEFYRYFHRPSTIWLEETVHCNEKVPVQWPSRFCVARSIRLTRSTNNHNSFILPTSRNDKGHCPRILEACCLSTTISRIAFDPRHDSHHHTVLGILHANCPDLLWYLKIPKIQNQKIVKSFRYYRDSHFKLVYLWHVYAFSA